jgi:hypothetical protein
MALDAGHALDVGGPALPADPPGLSRDESKGSHDQGEERISGGRGDRSMEGDVMLHHLGRCREGLAHRSRVSGNCLRLDVQAAQGGERNRTHLDRAAYVVDLLDAHLISVHRMVENEPQDVVVNCSHAGAPPVAEIHHPERRQGAQRLTYDCARDAKLVRDSGLRRNRVAHAQPAISDTVVDSAYGDLDPSSLSYGQQASLSLYDRFFSECMQSAQTRIVKRAAFIRYLATTGVAASNRS